MKIKFNKVTWYSKGLALAVLVILPFIFFWLGVRYGELRQLIADDLANQKQVLPAPASQGTEVFHYLPPEPPAAVSTESGSCFASSIAAPYRDDAWRCTVGNAISDPCFSFGTGSSLLCGVDPSDPSAASTFILTLTAPLPKPDGHLTPATPADGAWLIKLADGTVCTPFTGTLPFSAGGDVANYGCSDKRLIFGINTDQVVWTAKVGTLGAPADVNSPPSLISSAEVPIAAVWQ